MTSDLPFAPEITAAAHAIQCDVAAGKNDPLRHAWHLANAVEQLLERYFPDLTTANALEPQETVAALLEFYAATHEDTTNGPAPVAELP
jgi:hypothetical protein